MYQIRFFSSSVLLSLLLITYAFNYHEDRAAVERIKRYAKRQVGGTCMYNMCNETDGYPAEEIQQLIKEKAEYRDLFGTVVAPYKNKDVSIESRFNELDESNMCQTESIFMLPQRALDADGIWQTIVNIGGEFKQMVHFEACSPGVECYAQDHVPRGHLTWCETQEITFRMVTVGQDGELKMGHYPLPAGCICKYRFDKKSVQKKSVQ